MKERIAEILAVYGLTASKFAEILSVQPSGISHILSGRNKPGYDLIAAILNNFPNVSPDWLLLGTGDMLRKDDAPVSVDNADTSVPIPERQPELFGLDFNQGNVVNAEVAEGFEFMPEPDNNPAQENTSVHKSKLIDHLPKDQDNTPEIRQVMVFYSDNTVDSYTHKKR